MTRSGAGAEHDQDLGIAVPVMSQPVQAYHQVTDLFSGDGGQVVVARKRRASSRAVQLVRPGSSAATNE
ncbi:hypothetical protein ACWEO2_32470 [Nocardia sp. NPDC004278]